MPSFAGGPDLRGAITPLRLVFWGGLICVLDFRINGFDILNDVIGCILIAIGVFRLAKLEAGTGYRNTMTFVRIVSVLAIGKSILVQVGHGPEWWEAVVAFLGLVGLIATICFTVAMRTLCRVASFEKCVQSWNATTILFVLIYLIPLGIMYVIMLVYALGGGNPFSKPFSMRLDVWVLLLVPVFLAPVVHLFISTSRMKRQAENAAG
jgi:hypothetical protein